MTNITLFAQIISKLDRTGFSKFVQRHQSDKHQKGYNSWTHLVSMLFCQFAKSQSVRDISNGLRSATGNLNHLGVQKAPSKSSVSYQNKHRRWELFRDYYFWLLGTLGQQAGFRRVRFRIKSKILLMDSTMISLCLSIFDWAKYKKTKGALKLHTLLDFESDLPVYMNMTHGGMADNRGGYGIPLIKGSVIVADRGYNDFALLNLWDSNQVQFVVRHREDIVYRITAENTLSTERHPHIIKDQTIELKNDDTRRKYPKKIRRVVVWDEKNRQEIKLVTNQFKWSANTIAELYKSRWEIEKFFREIKQLLHIKTFVGTSPNAVLIQIWTALITILMIKCLKAMAKYGWHSSNLMAFIRLNLFVKTNLHQWLDHPFEDYHGPPKVHQGVLFGY